MRQAGRSMLGWIALAGTLIAGPVDAQRVAPERLARARATGEHVSEQVHAPPSMATEGLYVIGGIVSAGAAFGAATIGWYIDFRVCDSRGDDGDPSGLGCLFYAGAATKSGWLAGGAFGATAWASHAAERRGCPTREARKRAIRGAMLGAAPGAIAAANGRGTAPALIWVTPLLSGVGAASAVAGCRGARHTAAGG